jgi:hypothetical protein
VGIEAFLPPSSVEAFHLGSYEIHAPDLVVAVTKCWGWGSCADLLHLRQAGYQPLELDALFLQLLELSHLI